MAVRKKSVLSPAPNANRVPGIYAIYGTSVVRRRCPNCGRYPRPFSRWQAKHNADCSLCGYIEMPVVGEIKWLKTKKK